MPFMTTFSSSLAFRAHLKEQDLWMPLKKQSYMSLKKLVAQKKKTRFLLDARFNQKNSGSFYIFLHLPVFHNKKTKSAIPPFHCARLHL